MKLSNGDKRRFLKALEQGDYIITESGLIFPRDGLKASGVYFDSVNGGLDARESPNLLPDQGLTDILATYFGATAKKAGWYLALYSGAVSPAANWTAANFSATASEITSATEGYSNANRPTWTPGAAAGNAIDNLAAKAVFNIVCTTSIEVNGAALLSSNGKGSTSGVLASAARYAQPRQLYSGDSYELGYRVTLTS
ncbi:TPA: hypothetical protein ACVGN8_000215 [Pseudomonas aeruginosa]